MISDLIGQPLHMDCFDLLAQLPNECIDLIVTSPPYNCRKDYGTSSDEIRWPEWYALIERFLIQALRVLRSGGVIGFNIPSVIRFQRDHQWQSTWWDFDPNYETHREGKKVKGKGRIEPVGFRVFDMMNEIGFKLREPVIWVKGTEGNAITTRYAMGCDSDPYMRPCHEFILLGSKDRWFHDGGTGRRGREAVPFIDYTKDVWHITPSNDNDHPATFPPDIPLRLIRLFIHRANTQDLPEPIVADFFAGSFTTAIAAEKLGYKWICGDNNAKWVELGKRRLSEARQLELDFVGDANRVHDP